MNSITKILFLLIMLNKKGSSTELIAENSANLRKSLSNGKYDLIQPTVKYNPEGHCHRFQCKYICFKGNHSSIERDVNAVDTKECTFIKELHLINYEFPGKILPNKVLGSLCDRVNFLLIHSSDIEYIDHGAFQSETLNGVHLENLKLKHIDKDIFKNVSSQFTSFTLIQTSPELKTVSESFLENIKYQIKKLSIRTGLKEVENLTSSPALLNNLDDIDFSCNNFGGRLTAVSFNQVSVVQKLNLSHSAITFLPESIFNGIVVTLKVLDLSNNKLLVLGRNVFGWKSLTKTLSLNLTGNPWKCTCDLRTEMTVLLAFQEGGVLCENMENVLVTSEKLCPFVGTHSTTLSHLAGGVGLNGVESIPNVMTTTEVVQTTRQLPPSTSSEYYAYDTTHELECHKDNGKQETEHLSIDWPNTKFDIIRKKISEVDIVIRNNLNETYGVLWFNRVTLQYYKMETNHNEYGLGCYGRVEYITTINHLLPDLSYTFCLILKDHLTVSPFSCKSVYIDDFSNVEYNAWLTTNMKATGISLMIIGSVLFAFLGIILAFVLLKHKPYLIKGSKRVAMQKSGNSDIIVFPEDKTLQNFKLTEEQLAKNRLRGFPFLRRSSVSANSLESIQSYMNPENVNIYESIPAHQSLLNVRYAEVPFKRKRSSNDPLPEIPRTFRMNKSPIFAKKERQEATNDHHETDIILHI